MTTPDETRRFPISLTIAVAVAFAILIGLGVWQVRRLKWKEGILARIEAVRTSPPQPLALVLQRAAAGQDVEWTPVSVECRPGPGARQGLLYGLDGGEVAWRALASCGAGFPQGQVVIDRGFLAATRGAMTPARIDLPPPGNVTGVLRSGGRSLDKGAAIVGGYRFDKRDLGSLRALANSRGPVFYLVASAETPAPPGVTPAPLPVDIPNNHLGYAITWFGLAGALAAIYAAMLRRRLKG